MTHRYQASSGCLLESSFRKLCYKMVSGKDSRLSRMSLKKVTGKGQENLFFVEIEVSGASKQPKTPPR